MVQEVWANSSRAALPIVVDCVILLLQATSLFANGLVVFLFYRIVELKRSAGLRQMLFLCITDFLHALTTLPYIIYLATSWNPVYLNYDPVFIMVSSSPLSVQLKVHLTIMIAIAADRILALHFPAAFRGINHKRYAAWSLILGLSLGFFDIFLLFLFSSFTPRPGCAAIGCFVSDRYRYYWGTSNMVLGFMVLLLTGIIFVELKTLSKTSNRSTRDQARFKKANTISLCMLCSSLVFITLPSVGVGFVEMIGYSIFLAVGPFYIVGLLAAGCANSIIYVLYNSDIRKYAKSVLSGKSVNTFTQSVTFLS